MNLLGRLLINGENAMERDIPCAAEVFSKAIVEGNDTDALTYLLQLPLTEVGNAMRAYCYSIASYP